MKKSDLKNGMVTEYRYGDRRLVVGDRLMGESNFIKLQVYDEDLYYKDKVSDRDTDLDIVKIYDKIDTFNDLNNERTLDLIWERKWEPDEGEIYYVANPTNSCLYSADSWGGYEYEKMRYDKGLVFITKEEAIECANKMLVAIEEEQ